MFIAFLKGSLFIQMQENAGNGRKHDGQSETKLLKWTVTSCHKNCHLSVTKNQKETMKSNLWNSKFRIES